jgi:hypothetical protein
VLELLLACGYDCLADAVDCLVRWWSSLCSMIHPGGRTLQPANNSLKLCLLPAAVLPVVLVVPPG